MADFVELLRDDANDPARRSYPFNCGLLQGAIKVALIELEFGTIADVRQTLESALARVDANLQR
jgi:hypothetical protein